LLAPQRRAGARAVRADVSTAVRRRGSYERAEKNAASCGAPAPPPHLKELLSPPVNADGRFTPCLWNGML
jgi:hypothetical protein